MRIFSPLGAIRRLTAAFTTIGLLAAALSQRAEALPSFQQTGNTLIMSNANVRVQYNLKAGTASFYWSNALKIANFYSGVTLNTGYIKGTSYSSWSYVVTSSNQVAVTALGSGLPMMVQYFTLDQNDSFLVRVDVSGSSLSANWMGPVVVDSTGGAYLGVTNDNRALLVPFDNDGFVTYNAEPINNSGTSYEVGAFYDNTTRNGLVVGSVTHDKWKTGVFFSGANHNLTLLNVFGGATSPWDVQPHGYISGNTVSSPTMFVGFGPDWRVTMQNFAAENTNFVARLPWTNGVPFGWNSWGVIQQNISYSDAIAVSDYFYVNLMPTNFNNNGTVYINLDSFWNNLSSSQLQEFVNHVHAHGQKAGIYFGPFVIFLATNQLSTTYIQGSTNTWLYSDAVLKDSNGNYEMSDGGFALDPTHPGTKDMINYFINLYTNWGFDYIKIDFLSHGTFEGAHYDTNVTTGIEAYNQGMQYVLNAINGRMFISESIAPLFPYQYAHSRRISCDAEASLISNTAYVMNSVSYGWWLDNLYQFNDPDDLVFGNGADTNEAQSRLINGAVTGIFLNGDDLTVTNGQAAAETFLTNAAIDNVARVGQTFTPLEGNTGTSAVNSFVRQDGATWHLAVFNYTAVATNETISLSRAGLPPGTYVATNLWDGTSTTINGSLTVSLNEKQSKLFSLTVRNPESLQWTSAGNNGSWDSDASANWLNLSNDQQTVFNTGDHVLFDDTVGVPTTVTVNGTVSPNTITVNSSINSFTINGPGTISGSGSLFKEGSSTLTLDNPASFTGSATLSGGTLYAGNNSFKSVSAITITNNSTLDFGGGTYNTGQPVTVSGTGVSGEGALYNSYNLDIPPQIFNITLAGGTTFGGSARWDFDGGSLSGPYNVTVNWASGGYGEWNSVAIATNVGDIELANGSLGIKNMGATFGNPAASFLVDPGTTLDFWTGDAGYAKNFHVFTNGTLQMLANFTNFNGNLTFENGAQFETYYGSGNQTMAGTVTLNGMAHLVIGDSTILFTNVISGPGGLVWSAENNETVFTASNTYSGPTIIGDGLTLGLSGNGSISHSSLIFLGGATINVSGRSDTTLTLTSGQTLAGIGTIAGKLVVPAGTTLSPAGTNVTLGLTTGSSSTGTITANNNVTLNGTTLLKLNGSGVNDEITSSTSITYGGILNAVNISATPLAVGNSFQLFSAPAYSGSFSAIAPATPGAGLVWDTTQLTAGKLNVIAAPPSPVINAVAMSGSNLVFNGTNGTPNGNYVVLTTTNLNTPLINWVALITNTFDANGAFHVTNTIVPGTPGQFYCLRPSVAK